MYAAKLKDNCRIIAAMEAMGYDTPNAVITELRVLLHKAADVYTNDERSHQVYTDLCLHICKTIPANLWMDTNWAATYTEDL